VPGIFSRASLDPIAAEIADAPLPASGFGFIVATAVDLPVLVFFLAMSASFDLLGSIGALVEWG
jgi:hypothetical protein